jgi:hypothetical protein
VHTVSTHVHPDLVDRMIELYCDWRTDCAEVRVAYGRFLEASVSDRPVAFAAYMAALDREQCACEDYEAQVRQISSACAPERMRAPRRGMPDHRR